MLPTISPAVIDQEGLEVLVPYSTVSNLHCGSPQEGTIKNGAQYTLGGLLIAVALAIPLSVSAFEFHLLRPQRLRR